MRECYGIGTELVVRPNQSLTVDVGSIQIVNASTHGPGKGMTGMGTKIIIDGVEQRMVRSIELRIAVDEVVTAKIERLV